MFTLGWIIHAALISSLLLCFITIKFERYTSLGPLNPKTGRKQATRYFAMVLPLVTSSKFKPATVKTGNVPFVLNIPQNVYAHIFKDLHFVRTKLHVINFQLSYV